MATRDLPPNFALRPRPGTPIVIYPEGLPAAASHALLLAQPQFPRPVSADVSGPSKSVSVIPENEPDSARRVTLQPGTTVARAKELAGLSTDYSLKSPKNGAFLADDEDLYPMVEDGDKVPATPPFGAGGLFGRLKRALSGVQNEEDWLHAAGWKKVGDSYEGRFRMGAAEPIRGRVDLSAGRPQVYFWKLPALLAAHICIEKKGDSGWYWLHPERPPTTTSPRAIIAEVELFLQSLANPRLWRRGVA